MLILLSPAKNLDFTPVDGLPPPTLPRLEADTRALAKVTGRLSASQIAGLMDLSPKLADLNHARFQALEPGASGAGTREAVLAFNGDVYRGLDARSLDGDAIAWAQERVRILSGLYGLLRPLDAIQPYRLEMGTRLTTPRGASLYDFWGPRLARLIDADLAGHAAPVVVNLASGEYFSAVDRKALKAPVITVQFHELKDGRARVLGFFAKQARIEEPEGLKAFDSAGYRFDAGASTATDWVFARPQPPLKKG
jgi:uncharacterized protein